MRFKRLFLPLAYKDTTNKTAQKRKSGGLSTADKKVKDVHAVVCHALVQFGIAASGAGHRIEFFVLNVEQLGEISACGLKLV